VLEGEISRVSLLTIAVRGWGFVILTHPYSFQELIMENYDVYTSTTNREYKEQAEKAMKKYYDTFDEIETVRVSPRLQYVKKRLKQKRTSGGGGGGDRDGDR
jgi:hypothetical protein